MILENIVIFLLSAILSAIAIPLVYNLLLNNNCTALNFNKDRIPVGIGLVFILVQTFIVFIFTFYKELEGVYSLSYLIAILIMGVVGIVDDIIGEKEVKGFKGHIYSLLKLRLTTGGLKLIAGGVAAALVSLTISINIVEFILNSVLIALFTNLINLFDLRPGRANKIFIILSLILMLTAKFYNYNYLILSSLGIIFVYMPYDLNARAMMGDVGSNALGMTLGVFCAGTQSFKIKVIYLIFLIIIHIVSEFYSFTKIIDNNRLLRYVDRLGRK